LPGLAPRGKAGDNGGIKYVYILESIAFPAETYIGLTDDLRARLAAHNAGQARHTSKLKRLLTSIAFADEEKAVAFERYLKSSSGRAFAKKRLR
jgi:predicted GIY-YIG superfamily endonuclease